MEPTDGGDPGSAENGSVANGIKLSLNVRCINMLRVSVAQCAANIKLTLGVLMHNRVIALLFVASWIALPASAEKAAASAERVNSALAQLDTHIRASLENNESPWRCCRRHLRRQSCIFARLWGSQGRRTRYGRSLTLFLRLPHFRSPSPPRSSRRWLAKEGSGWDDRIADLDPGFQLSSAETTRQTTIRDFLSHRSGLATESGDLLEDLGYSRPQILYRMRYLPLPGQFRRTYAYSNFGYTTGAIAAATKIGKPWRRLPKRSFMPGWA